MSHLHEFLTRTGAGILGSRPFAALRLRRIRSLDPLIILNLHRVAPPDGSEFRPISPALFDELLAYATAHFAVTSFAEIDQSFDKPRLILSFDDGYRDFVDYAAPLLAKHGVGASQNVIPSCAESGLPPLQVLVADFLGSAPEELIGRLDVPGFGMGGRHGRWQRLDLYLRHLPHVQLSEVADALIPQMMAWDGFRPAAMMSPAQIAEVSRDHDIGGHSVDHVSMANESDEYLRKDVARCGSWIERVTGRPMRNYAFPNGSFRIGQPALVRALGVDHVLLTGGGFGGRDGIHDRIGVSASNRSEVRFRALGARARLPRSAA